MLRFVIKKDGRMSHSKSTGALSDHVGNKMFCGGLELSKTLLVETKIFIWKEFFKDCFLMHFNDFPSMLICTFHSTV